MPRGRNKDLIDKRNEALCRRWYYWTEVQRLRFDDALKILSEQEFFISEDRVMAIIRQLTPLFSFWQILIKSMALRRGGLSELQSWRTV